MVTILIVEDDLSLLKLYKMILEFEGFDTYSANNGEKAVNVFKSFSEKPKIILMDHRMPIKNGIDAAKEILAIDYNAKIIFVSADASIKNKALSIGAIKFIKKPFSLDYLIRSIKTALNLSECANIV